MAINKPLRGFTQSILREFLSILHKESSYARTSRFEVTIFPPRSVSLPEGMNAGNSLQLGELVKDGTNRHVSMKCNNINMPGRTVNQVEDTTLIGPSRSIVTGTPTYADITTQFTMLNSNGNDRKFFTSWQGAAVDEIDFSAQYYDDYVGEMNIYLLNEKNERMYGCRLLECFPKVVGDFALNSETRNTLVTMDVTWSYRYWDVLEGSSDLPRRIVQGAFDLLVDTVERKLLKNVPKFLRYK